MRPITNFTLHATLAAALIAFAAASAAAQGTPTLRIVTETPNLPAGKGEQLEILSFQWGPRQSTSAWELEPARITSYQLGGSGGASGGGSAVSGRVTGIAVDPSDSASAAQKEMVLKGKAIGQNSTVGANETISVGGAQAETASGQATGNRQHKPMTITKEWDARSAPLPQGSVRVKVKMPWLACRVGASYPRLELAGGGKTYVLEDVTVASCSASGDADDRPTEEVAFYYNRIK